MADSATPKPMPVTSLPDRVTPGEQRGDNADARAKLGKMHVTNGRPPKGGK